MSGERNASGNDGADLVEDGPSALGFDDFGSSSEETAGVGDCVLWIIVAAKRKIGAEQSLRFGASHGANVVLHFFHRYESGIGISEHDHSQRIANEDERDTCFIEDSSGGIIVSSKRRDAFAALFHGA